MEIFGIVAALAPDHALHAAHEQTNENGPDVQVKCSCGVRLTFLATEIAKLNPVQKAEIAFQVGGRSDVSPPSVEPIVRKAKVSDGS
jgi:hypothetical protein